MGNRSDVSLCEALLREARLRPTPDKDAREIILIEPPPARQILKHTGLGSGLSEQAKIDVVFVQQKLGIFGKSRPAAVFGQHSGPIKQIASPINEYLLFR